MVDADNIFCKLIKNTLYDIKKCEYTGYATNGISGYYSIMAAKPDIIILDYILPELDGITLLNRIDKMENYYPYIIMFCGLGNEMIVQQVLINGANICCVQPYSIEEIISLIKQAIDILDSVTQMRG